MEQEVAFVLVIVGFAYGLFFVYGFYDLAKKLFVKKNQNRVLRLVYNENKKLVKFY